MFILKQMNDWMNMMDNTLNWSLKNISLQITLVVKWTSFLFPIYPETRKAKWPTNSIIDKYHSSFTSNDLTQIFETGKGF